jgi:putative protease
MSDQELVGKVTHYFGKIGVAAIKLAKPLKSGDKLHFRGATTDFQETVESMQIGHQIVASAQKGAEIGLKVGERVRDGDKVYFVKE